MSLRAKARKRLMMLLVGAVLLAGLGGGAFLFRKMRVERRYADLRQRGLAASVAGDDIEAVNFLSTYLVRHDNDVEALAAFARSRPKVPLPDGEHLRETASALRQLLRLDPNRPDDWRQLMRLYSQFGMMTEANGAADQLLSLVPGDGEAQSTKVVALMRLHRFDQALTAAQVRVAAAPDDWMSQINLLRCMNNQGAQPDEILNVANKATQAYPNDQGAMLLQAIANVLAKQNDKAEACLMAAAKLPYKNKDVGFLLAQYLDDNGTHRDALGVLRQIAASGDPDGRRVLLRRLWETNRLAEAAKLFTGPDPTKGLTDSQSIGFYADVLLHLNRSADAAAQRDLLAARKDDLMAAAWYAIENDQVHPTPENAGAALDACSKAVERGANGYLVYYQGVAKAQLGETNQAIDLWTKAAQLQPTWPLPDLDKAQALLNQGNQDAASDAAIDATRRASDIPGPAIMLALVWYAQFERGSMTRLGDLNSLIDEIQQYAPGEEQTLRMRVALLAHDGQTDKAAQALRQLLAKQPPPSEKTLAELVALSRAWHLGLESDCIKLMEQVYGRTPEALLSEALDDARNNHADEGLKLLQTASSSATGDQAPTFARVTATYLEATGNAGATAAWVAAGDRFPGDLNLQRAALNSPAAYRDRAFFDRTIERMRALLGDQSASWKIARARWLMDGSNDPKTTADSIALLQDALTLEPESVAANVLMGQAKVRAGDVNAATAMFANAQRLDPKSNVMALDMARLLQFRGDYQGAGEQLDKVAKDPMSTPQQLADAAAMLASQGDVQQAVDILQPIAGKPEATEPVKLQLASLYCRLKDFDHAQAIADQLMVKPDAQAILLAADIAMFRNQPQTAEKTLARLKELTWKPGEMERTQADYHFFLGQYEQAATAYRSAAQAAPDDAANWIGLMNCQAVMGKPADLAATVAEALSHLPNNAHFLALQQQADLLNGPGDSQTEQQCLVALIADPSPDGPAAQTLAAIRRTQVSSAPPSEILQALQKLSVDLPRFLPAQTALIEAQLRLGRCEDAVQSANAAVQSFPNDARPAELATIALAVFERWNEALQMAHVWRDRVLGEDANVDMKIAQIQIQLGDTAGAIATLQPYLNSTELSPQSKWLALLTEAQALVHQDQTDAAAQTLWPFAQSHPPALAEFMSFVAANLPAPQAEQWLNRVSALLAAQANSEQEQVSLATAWDLLAQRSGDKRYAQTARDLAARLQQVPAASGSAAMVTAMFLQADGDAKDAQAAYRLAVSKADLPQAKNNLAMLLADNGGDLAEATDLARQCVKDDPRQAAYFDTLAYILGRDKNYDEAMQAIQTAVRLQPDNAKWYVNTIKLLVAAGKTDQAKQMLAELDLMTPGVRVLPKNYLRDLDGLRKQLAGAAGSVSLTP